MAGIEPFLGPTEMNKNLPPIPLVSIGQQVDGSLKGASSSLYKLLHFITSHSLH